MLNSQMKMMNPEGPITISSESLSPEIYKSTPYILASQFWHKIILYNVESDSRELVLTTLMELARPHDFIPVNYEVQDDKSVTFLIKNCGQAILQFCSLNLIVAHPVNKNRPPYKMKIILCEKLASQFTICMKTILTKILKKRYDRSKNMMNLDAFHLDPDLTEFFHLSQMRLLYFVLHLCREFDIKILKLSNNSIDNLNSFQNVANEKCYPFKHLTEIDLSNNKIKTLDELDNLKKWSIKTINLDGNPCCNGYKDTEYLKNILKFLPNVTKLDSCFISKLGLLPCRRNYICTQNGHELVDKFLEHYFTLYDSNARGLLSGMYHNEAMFSISQQLLAEQSSSKTTNLMMYRKYTRNIKTIMDLSKSSVMMYVGTDTISRIQTSLPPTEHDPNTFTVDVTIFQDTHLSVTVTGVFKHRDGAKLSSDMYNFMRTFLLQRVNDDEYLIINDIMHITNVTTVNESVAFRFTKEPEMNVINVPSAKSPVEMDEMVDSLMIITLLKKEWAKKCLQECKYDFKKALNLFVNLHKQDKLPLYAFHTNEETMLQFMALEKTAQERGVQDKIRPESRSSQESCNNKIQINNGEINLDTPYRYTTEEVEKISDEHLKKIKQLDKRMSTTEKRFILNNAKSVLGNYKNPWYVCYVGLHLYKLEFLDEARKLLAKSEFYLTPEQFKKIGIEFLLFEIEFGETRQVDSWMRKKILMESVDSVMEFVLNHVPNISRGMTRSLFRRMTEYKLPINDIRKIINAFKKFELVYGTDETLEQAIKLQEKHFPSRKRTISPISSYSSCNSQRASSKKRSLSKSPVAETRKSKTRDQLPKQPNPIYSTESVSNSAKKSEVSFSSEQQKAKAEAQFENYKLSVLKLLGVYTDRVTSEDIKAIENFRGDNKSLISMCNATLAAHNNHYAVVMVVYKKYWNRNMKSNIQDLLAQAKDFTEKALVKNLIVLFKIRLQLQQRKQSDTLQKINLHLDQISFKDALNFFEALSHETGNDVDKIFESCLENECIEDDLKEVILLKYKAYCIKNNLNGFEKYKQDEKLYGFIHYSANDNIFNFEQMLEMMKETPDPINLTGINDMKSRGKAALEYLKKHNYALFNCVHLVRFLFLKQFKELAFNIINQCNRYFSDNPDAVMDNTDFHFSLMVALISPNTRKSAKKLDVWREQFENNVNYIGTLAETYLMRGSTQLARSIIVDYLKKPIILDVDVQKGLYQYFESWKKKFGINMLSMALSIAEKDANAKDDFSEEEVLISSEED